MIPILLQNALGTRKEFSVFSTDYDTSDGLCIRDYIHVTGPADTHIKALKYFFDKSKSKFFNLGTRKGMNVLESVDAVEHITGRKINISLEDRCPGDPDALIVDNSKAKEILRCEQAPIHL